MSSERPHTSGGTVAVLGGSGFIGRSLVRRLASSGARVRVIDTRGGYRAEGVEGVRADVRDPGSLRVALAGAETVYNLAAARGTEAHPWSTYEALNVRGAEHVCAAAADCGVSRIVFTSTAAVYGHGRGPTEDSPCRPAGDYGRSKLLAERVYRAWVEDSDGRSLTIVRPTVVFGPGDDGAGNRLIRAVSHPDFALAGEGRQRKSLAFVDNVAAFLVFASSLSERSTLFNYADRPSTTLADIARTVRGALDLPPAPSRTRRSVYVAALSASFARLFGREPRSGFEAFDRARRERCFDAERAHSSGFRQPVDLHEALRETALEEGAWAALVQRARR